jgi:raffinose/stachyose/melibiose transport system permease protein
MTTSPLPPAAPAAAPRRRNGGGERTPRANSLLKLGHWWWAVPGILMVVAVHYAATAVGASMAFTNWTGIGSFEWIGLRNFQRIFSDPTKLLALRNTLVLAFASVLLSNLAGMVLAMGLNRILKTRFILRTLFFMPVVLSPLATSYIWKFIFQLDGPLNSILEAIGLDSLVRPWLADPSWALWAVLLVVVWQNTGFAMVIYMSGLAAVPVEVEEAAAIDGANMLQRIWHVTIPALRPAIAIATTLGIVNGLRIFDQILALTGGGPANATSTLATEVYKQAFTLGNFGYGAALALLLTLIILVFAVIQQRVTQGPSET